MNVIEERLRKYELLQYSPKELEIKLNQLTWLKNKLENESKPCVCFNGICRHNFASELLEGLNS